MDRRVASWHRVDIRRVPTLVKEVDALEKQVAELKKALPDTEISVLLDAVERRVDEVDELRRTHVDDPRAVHLDHQLLRLREVAQTLAKPAPRTATPNARLFNGPQAKSTPTARTNSNQQLTPPAKPAKQQPLYKWETKDPAPRSWTKLAPSRDFYVLREPGHYATESPVLNTLELDGAFEFQIVMTLDEWKTHQYEGRRLAAETKHLERAKKASVAKTPRYTAVH
ncbi:hypothetical protein SDRG_06731 [Saprolegnia diclina VS20]|uniref:Uncharacterized protein n=1 Tax=Saprolegnia diclina (strain VS20) TaxID=1156394 RepID=T0QQ71_SAPDV|nr:hypothetical protein SDRG_06731 [Saprolegnia diclina VS20]EQC35990.1 hypothetical protein SDRG_06731 [Saprolegnia diclina VS20]|eukprot:XP_008610752.1 hypothetical protein SDRG_06731 [Saprolegnia diclina VS20]